MGTDISQLNCARAAKDPVYPVLRPVPNSFRPIVARFGSMSGLGASLHASYARWPRPVDALSPLAGFVVFGINCELCAHQDTATGGGSARRWMRCRIVRNKPRGTATSAIWNVTDRA